MPIDKLIELLLREPLILVIVIGWIAGGIGKAIHAKKKRAELQQRRAPSSPPTVANGGSQGSLPQRAETARRARTAEEVAAEMRRILGMEPALLAKREQKPAPKPAAPRQPPAPPLRRPEAAEPLRRQEASEGDVGSHVMRPSQFARIGTHVDPHVGESMQARKSPRSGGVAAHEMGTLGGRGRSVSAVSEHHRGLAQLGDLKRAIVIFEILSAPRAMREWDR